MRLKQVVVHLEGGLGNQIFQYASGRSLADRLGCELLLDLRGLSINADRHYQLDLYRIRAAVASKELLEQLPHWQPSRWKRIRSKVAQKLPFFSYPIFWSQSFSYDKNFENLSRPIFMSGYWQTEKYFKNHRVQILQDLSLINKSFISSYWSNEIVNSCSVALHVRRGDYVNNSAAANFHGLCTIYYYKDAVDYLKKYFPEMKIFVFSDEPAWARENLQLGVPTHIVDCHTPEQGHLDLELMRLCKHHIIANSTFSWWGAWLCENDDQHVIAPSRWFADTDIDTSDVVPQRWIRL